MFWGSIFLRCFAQRAVCGPLCPVAAPGQRLPPMGNREKFLTEPRSSARARGWGGSACFGAHSLSVRAAPAIAQSRGSFGRDGGTLWHIACIWIWAAMRPGRWRRCWLRPPMRGPRQVDRLRFFTSNKSTLDLKTPSRDDLEFAIRVRGTHLHFSGAISPAEFWSVRGPGAHPDRRPA